MVSQPSGLVPVLSVAAALTFLLNLTICCLVLARKDLRTCTNAFLMSLAFSDLLTGGVLMPLLLTVPGSPATGYFISIILLAGVANHVAITFDRFVAVCYPFRYAAIVKKHWLRVVGACWFTVLLVSLLPLCWGASQDAIVHTVYLFVELGAFILVPYVFVFVAYCRIFYSLRKHQRSLAREGHLTASRRAEARRVSIEGKVARIFLVLVLMFVLCWLPIIYLTAVDALGLPHLIPPHLDNVSLVTLILASLVDPLLYSFKKDDFRNAFKSILRMRDIGAVDPHGRAPSRGPGTSAGAESSAWERTRCTPV